MCIRDSKLTQLVYKIFLRNHLNQQQQLIWVLKKTFFIIKILYLTLEFWREQFMSHLTSDDSGASQLIGYVYTALISVLILSSMMLTSSTMLNGSVSNTVQEEAEQLALYFQLAVEDLLNTVREYPDSSPTMVLDTGIEAINHGIQYKVSGLNTGLKVTTIQPRGGSFEVNFPIAPAISIETTDSAALMSTTSYIVISYDDNLKVVKLTSG